MNSTRESDLAVERYIYSGLVSAVGCHNSSEYSQPERRRAEFDTCPFALPNNNSVGITSTSLNYVANYAVSYVDISMALGYDS